MKLFFNEWRSHFVYLFVYLPISCNVPAKAGEKGDSKLVNMDVNNAGLKIPKVVFAIVL